MDTDPLVTTQTTAEEAANLRWGRGSSQAMRTRLLSGSLIMLISFGLAGAINLVYNLAVAHALGAEGFGHASAVYTLLMLLSAVTLSFQILCAKLVPRHDTINGKAGIYRLLHRYAWVWGASIGVLLILASGPLSSYLNLPARHYYVILLSLGITFYVPLGVRRGLLQGMYDFFHLALNYLIEVVVKLVGALLLIYFGFGVPGVIAAVVISIIVPYLMALPPRELRHTTMRPSSRLLFGEGVQASVFFVGQVIINNLDIVLVKHFFDAAQAGLYATVALIGRIVYMLSWSVVSSMFPISAGARTREGERHAVLGTTLLIVAGIASMFTFCLWLAPASLWRAVLGSGFPLAGHNPYASLLILYAATTGIYALSVVLMSYEISRKIGSVSWLQLGFGGAIIAGIYLFHGTLRNVIEVQMVLMVLLLTLVSIPFMRTKMRATIKVKEPLGSAELPYEGIIKLHRVSEDHVIAEFLKNEFYLPEFAKYYDRFEQIVYFPDLANRHENVVRKALLFKRRGRMWRELPPDTEWWEVRVRQQDLNQIRIFPRSQWRKVADDGYFLPDVVDHLQAKVKSDPEHAFSQKLRETCNKLRNKPSHSSILMIGMDEFQPLTIIEGNHRMAAANLLAPLSIHPCFTFLCGFSPRMKECCWYQTDLSTLWRYAKNIMAFYFEDPDSAIAKAIPHLFEKQATDPSVGPA